MGMDMLIVWRTVQSGAVGPFPQAAVLERIDRAGGVAAGATTRPT